MAEKDAKTKKSAGFPIGFFEVLLLIVVLFWGANIAIGWWNAHKSTWSTISSAGTYYLINFFAKYAVFAFLFSIAMIIVVVLYARRYEKMREKIMTKILPTDGTIESNTGGAIENPKWKLVLEHVNSSDASKWKLAILEADIILDDLLGKLDLPGNGIGEKLKAVDPADFTSLNEAWEGHKIRNAIAHEGSDFLINQREAQRVVALYQKVFKEFEMI